jgi:hypothetical protein
MLFHLEVAGCAARPPSAGILHRCAWQRGPMIRPYDSALVVESSLWEWRMTRRYHVTLARKTITSSGRRGHSSHAGLVVLADRGEASVKAQR